MTIPVSGIQGAMSVDWPLSGKSLPHEAPARSAPTASDAPVPLERPQRSPEERLREAARLLQEYVQQSGRDMKFTVDNDSGRTVVRIYNRATGDLVRQVPGEEALRVAALLRQDLGESGIDERI